MLKPDEVKKAAKSMEADNLRFRSFLKNHADEEELDKQFLAIHNELFADYEPSTARVIFLRKMESANWVI